MTNGDIAAARGWTTFASTQSAKNGYDDINYALDRAAAAQNELDSTVMPAINQPIFAVGRSSTTVNLAHRAWTVLPASAYSVPRLNSGFASWSNGKLTIQRSGVYRVGGSMHMTEPGNPYTEVGLQLVKNGTSPDTANTLAEAEVSGVSASFSKLVSLVAGDVLVLLALQWYDDNSSHPIRNLAGDLSIDLEWVRG